MMRKKEFTRKIKEARGIVELQRKSITDELIEHRLIIEDVVLEQFTGLRDKNSKKIYEGSLIKEVVYGRKSVIWEVRYSQDDCCFELHRIRGAYFGDSLLGGDDSQYEIIGDIHRNHELLEEVK